MLKILKNYFQLRHLCFSPALASLDMYGKIHEKMYEGCECFIVRGAFLVLEVGGELKICETDQNPPFFSVPVQNLVKYALLLPGRSLAILKV